MGSYHTVAIASGSVLRIFVWGLNNYGQLGLGHLENAPMPTRMDLSTWAPHNMTGSDVQFSGGQHHSLITALGRVYVCGRGHFGTLGLGLCHLTPLIQCYNLIITLGKAKTTEISIPTLITSLKSVSAVECGSSVCYALTEMGEGYAWGMGTCYQLTTGMFLAGPFRRI